MRTIAIPNAVNPLSFGRRRPAVAAGPVQQAMSEDVRLFLWTFAAGFLAMSIFLS